jgi:L-histidine Nalpha-methyltransferase
MEKQNPTHKQGNQPAAEQTMAQPDPDFVEHVKQGLTASAKYLPSKYLYNKKGDQIFQQIMAMDEYYPTRCEYEIFDQNKVEMLNRFQGSAERFDLIEFGAGDGMKTKVLLQHFWKEKANFSYVPIDISCNIVNYLTDDLAENMPGLEVEGICDDYFRAFQRLNEEEAHSHIRKVVLFLGANIGNFTHEQSITFLKRTASFLNHGDRLLIGFDLKKEPQRILNAYFDKHNITQSFKLNLLDRINEELGGEFEKDNFKYFPFYDPVKGTVKSHLVSCKEQDIYIASIDTTIHFDEWEAIYMEKSQKYSLKDIEKMAEESGFQVMHNFFDRDRLFTDSLWTLR